MLCTSRCSPFGVRVSGGTSVDRQMSRAKPNGREFFDRRKKVQKSELSQHICDRNEKLLNQVVVVVAVHLSCRKVRSLCPTVLGRFSLRCLLFFLTKCRSLPRSTPPSQTIPPTSSPSHRPTKVCHARPCALEICRQWVQKILHLKSRRLRQDAHCVGVPVVSPAGVPLPPPIYPPAPPGSEPAQLSFSSLGKQGVLAGYCTGLFFCAATQTSANCHSPYTHTARFVREERGHGCQTAIRAACATCIAT